MSDAIKRLPPSLLYGAKRLERGTSRRAAFPADPSHVQLLLGIRRINDRCIELETQSNDFRNGWAVAIGQMMVFAPCSTIFFWAITSPPITTSVWMLIIFMPWIVVAMAYVFYMLTGGWQNRGAFIRIHRGTRKIYYIAPGKEHVTELKWDEIIPLIGFVPLASVSGYNALYPLYLVGLDTELPRPMEVCLSCGNRGVRDDGVAARWLWDYLQLFMAEGPAQLPRPAALPPRLTRGQTFMRRIHTWSAKLRADLATPKGRRWALLLVPGKLLWLIVDVFPDALGDWIQYHVPYTAFPRAIDELCDMPSPQVDDDGA